MTDDDDFSKIANEIFKQKYPALHEYYKKNFIEAYCPNCKKNLPKIYLTQKRKLACPHCGKGLYLDDMIDIL